MRKRNIVIICLVLTIAGSSFYLTQNILSFDERLGIVVLIVAAGFWTTEAIPLVATSLLIPIMQSLLGIQSFNLALRPFFDPVVMLLLGGFLLAISVEKHDLDEYLAIRIISRIGVNARLVVLTFMLTTAFLSMWISNTASTALMLTIALKLTNTIRDETDNFSKILVLGIAYSATAGGLATLVGTPTCAMAVGFLRDIIGLEITFLGWMSYGLPITLAMVATIWGVLFFIFPTDVKDIQDINIERISLNPRQKMTLAVFSLAILLWLSGNIPEPLSLGLGWTGHGLSSSMVAGIISILLLTLGLINDRDISRANWGSLLLIGAGLSLGSAMEVSGLMTRIGESLFLVLGKSSVLITITLITAFSLGISIIASNTASASIFLPIAIGLGTSHVSPIALAVIVGISTSLDFMLPVGTPPNAIAYSTGKVSMREMIKAGIMLDIVGALIVIMMAYFFWA